MASSDKPKPSTRPLEGLRVLDLSRMMAGPYGTTAMGDLGAHVIRVEDIQGSCVTRHNAPFVAGESHYFLSINRNKESIALDLKTAEGRAIVLDLVRQSDVVVENFRVGVAKRLGLDHATLMEINPSLIYCSVTGFGQTGPWATTAAYDLVIQAVTGAMSTTGEPGREPCKMGLPLADAFSSLYASIAVMAAIERRDRTGAGCYLDISMYDSGVAMLSYMADSYFATGSSPTPQGSSHPTIYPYNAFQAADRHLVVAPFTNGFWRKFCRVLGRPELSEDENFRTFADRLRNRERLAAIIEPIVKQRTVAEWVAALDAGDVPNGPVANVKEALESDQCLARGMIVELDHPVCGPVKTVGTPFHFTHSDGSTFAPATVPPPVLGQHTASIMRDLLDRPEDEIQRLVANRAIAVSPVEGRTTAQPRRMQPPASSQPKDALPLSGLRVLDLTRMLAGPYATVILADLGADVIKIEEPQSGDPTRHNLPRIGDESAYFFSLNRGKRGVTLDLKSREGRERFLEIARIADIVVENYRPGVMEKLGLSYERLRQANEDIILCSISGFGQNGPLRDKISFDLVNQAMAGIMSVTGEPDRAPIRIGLPVGDLAGGIYGAMGVLAAVYDRRRRRRGAHLDLALNDALLSLLTYVGQLHLTTGEIPGPVGSGHHRIAPYRAFRASDGHFVIAAFSQDFWTKFVHAIAMPELLEDARFKDLNARKKHKPELYRIIDPLFPERTVDQWLHLFSAADVPAARVNTVGQVLGSQHTAARELVFEFDHPSAGRVRTVGTPFKADGRNWRTMLPPPLLGQHNEEILGGIGEASDAARVEAVK